MHILLWLKMKSHDLEERPSWWQRLRHWRREEQQHKNNIESQLEPMSGGQQPEQFKTTKEGNESSEQSKPSKKDEQQSKASKSGDSKQPEQSNTVKEGKESPEQDKTSKKREQQSDTSKSGSRTTTRRAI